MKNYLELTLNAVISECSEEDATNTDFLEIEQELKKSVNYELSQARVKFCDFCLKATSLEEIKECANLVNEIRKVIDSRFEYEQD